MNVDMCAIKLDKTDKLTFERDHCDNQLIVTVNDRVAYDSGILTGVGPITTHKSVNIEEYLRPGLNFVTVVGANTGDPPDWLWKFRYRLAVSGSNSSTHSAEEQGGGRPGIVYCQAWRVWMT